MQGLDNQGEIKEDFFLNAWMGEMSKGVQASPAQAGMSQPGSEGKTKPSMTKAEALRGVVEVYLETIREATKKSELKGIPDGVLYSVVMGQDIELETHLTIVEVLKEAGLVEEKNHLLVAVEQPGRWTTA